MITHRELKEELRYEPDTGLFFWVKKAQGRRVLAPAGHTCKDGYVHIYIFGKLYRAHRLAWMYVHGEFPKVFIDHANGNTSDNRLCNLREADTSQNSHNAKTASNNKSGYKGVSFNKSSGKYIAQCNVNNIHHYLGLFKTAHDASAAYEAFASKHHKDFYYGNRKI